MCVRLEKVVVEVTEQFRCCHDYCESCGEHHGGMCPPHELRVTGIEWFRQRIRHLEELLEAARSVEKRK